MKNIKAAVLLSACILAVLTGCQTDKQTSSYFQSSKKASFKHIKGLGFAGESSLYIATEKGIHKYEDSKWHAPSKNRNDYLSLAVVKDGIYSSGYKEGTKGKPLGLVKSGNQGESLKTAGGIKKQAYDQLAASYKTGEVYLFSRIEGRILHTADGGKKWSKSKLKGLTSKQLGGIAAHPDQAGSIGIFAKEGIFLSTDFGESFRLFPSEAPVTALVFGEGSIVYADINEGRPSIYLLDLATMSKRQLSFLDAKPNNPILYLSINPEDQETIAAATYENEIFLSRNSGQTWEQIKSSKKK
ncbi:WD40/YVTN/BNR-like repeat-containing protein [Peribacillus sp. SCS-37]|uniref:WD40/YVTN/BNR-like repeat-containing protein n=1 Tax=Paraperibacillus esterisolvens TaxID=3115296 RepID=UPI0039063F55